MHSNNPEQSSNRFSVFGIDIDNVTMNEAISWVTQPQMQPHTQIGYFVNANSLNQAFCNKTLVNTINQADAVFADGSGVRIAAKFQGIDVVENVNGTDMLPLLCQKAVDKGLSIFLLGAAPGIAQTAAENLLEKFPTLKISGTHHGYVDSKNQKDVINQINASGADILLVGMGTPIQESWLQANRWSLNVNVALAVGGLFDFYSGRIPRAPIFMRRAGIEWVWRLIQEPKNKFKRYVLGNPLFLFRIAFNL